MSVTYLLLVVVVVWLLWRRCKQAAMTRVRVDLVLLVLDAFPTTTASPTTASVFSATAATTVK